MRICFEDFGTAPLVAEYDAEQQAILINTRAVERMRVRHGEAAAQALVACAVAHERYHVMHPGCDEEAAHAFARARTGHDPRLLEAMLR